MWTQKTIFYEMQLWIQTTSGSNIFYWWPNMEMWNCVENIVQRTILNKDGFYQSFIFLVQLLCFVICLTSCAAQSYLQMHCAIKSKVELTKYWEPRDKIESKWNFCHCHRGRAGQSKMKEWLVFNSLKLHQTRKTLVPPPPPALFLASGKMIFCWQKHLKGCNN